MRSISNWDVNGKIELGIGEKHVFGNLDASTVLSFYGFMGQLKFYCNDQNCFFFNRMHLHKLDNFA